MIDPDVRAGVRTGLVRVLVELRVPPGGSGAPSADAIKNAQDAVLARLAPSQASIARRYTTVPLLALDIDAHALSLLEAMSEAVVRVHGDRTARPH